MSKKNQTQSDEAASEGTNQETQTSGPALLKVADDLEAWADSIDAEDDPSVQHLVGALRSDDDLTVWAEVDLDTCLPQGAKPSPPKEAWRRRLTVLRNILVFLPIAFAWLSIRSVTSSYRRYAANNPEAPVDFLSYWSSPSRGIEQLQAVALAITFVVAAIIVVTVLIAATDVSSSKAAARELASRERERSHLLLKLRLALAPRRKVDLDNVEASLTSAIEDFRRSSNLLRESTAQLHEIFDSTEALGPQLERSTQQMNDIVSMMQRDLSGSIAELTGQVRSLGHELSEIDSKLGQSLEQRVEHVVSLTSGLSRDFDTLGERLKQTCLAAEASASRLAAMTGGLAYPPQADD